LGRCSRGPRRLALALTTGSPPGRIVPERDRRIATAVSATVRAELRKANKASGWDGAGAPGGRPKRIARRGERRTRRRVAAPLDACTVRVASSLTETDRGALFFGPPKSAAGRRTVQLPPLLVPSLHDHLDRYAQPGDDGLVFTGPNGALLRRSNFRRRVWLPALAQAGLPEIHFHDLRHTGNILTATAGASLRELMARMGHASTRAALVYLHDTDDRQRAIAAALSDLAQAGLAPRVVPPEP